MPKPKLDKFGDPCPVCLAFYREGYIRREEVRPLTENFICDACAAAEDVAALNPAMTFQVARFGKQIVESYKGELARIKKLGD